jgi:phage N-6-adenine-methyltransferase
MRTTFLHQGDVIDSDAVRIGALYKKANIIGNVQYLIEAGKLLLQKKIALGHSKWLPWLKDNEETLGFKERCAQRLIWAAQLAEANPTLASDLNESKALKISREVWGHNHFRMTGDNEWFTPSEYIERARAVLGGIDLDPATCAIAQRTIRATAFYSKDDNGLAHEWHGRVWLNPPYARPLIEPFIDKLLNEITQGRVTAAILLTHSSTDTAWFQKAARSADAICFLRGRINFVSPTGKIATPAQGQAFFYFGSDVSRFREVFGQIGLMMGTAELIDCYSNDEMAGSRPSRPGSLHPLIAGNQPMYATRS